MTASIRICCVVIVLLCLVSSAEVAEPLLAAPGYPWATIDAKKNVVVNLYIFSAPDCKACPDAIAFAKDLQRRHPWVKVSIFDRGQALFHVAKDSHRRFVVYAAGNSVTATGTKFDVRVDPDRFNVILLEGRVHVQTAAGHQREACRF